MGRFAAAGTRALNRLEAVSKPGPAMLNTRFLNLPDRGISLHVRCAHAEGAPAFLMSHGLSSNCLTWEQVALKLHGAGCDVVTVDQRGHGRSDKPDCGYDFESISADMEAVITALKLERPVFLGQSWGGNVALHLAATRPDLLSGVGFIDGGFLSLRKSLGSDWETVKERLSPPDFRGRQVEGMREGIQSNHPDWTPTGVQHTLGNFSVADDGTVFPNLSLDNHLRILRKLWEMDPADYYHRVRIPVLICPVESLDDPERAGYKRQQVAVAEEGLARCRTVWFEDTDHDIHVHRPDRLANVLLEAVSSGFWSD